MSLPAHVGGQDGDDTALDLGDRRHGTFAGGWGGLTVGPI